VGHTLIFADLANDVAITQLATSSRKGVFRSEFSGQRFVEIGIAKR